MERKLLRPYENMAFFIAAAIYNKYIYIPHKREIIKMKKQKQSLNEGILDGLLTKFVRILLSPTESRLMVQAAKDNKEVQKKLTDVQKILISLKKDISTDPDIQGFLKYYDQKYGK